MKKLFKNNGALPRLGDIVRPSVSNNKEIISATSAGKLGELFDSSYNAKIGVLAKTNQEIERLVGIAEKLLKIVPKEKLNYVNFIIVDNRMDLRNEVFASPEQLKNKLTDEEIDALRKSALSILSQTIQKGCVIYAQMKDKNWNKDELRNELEKMKDYVYRSISERNENKQKKMVKPLLFTKKKGIDVGESSGNLKQDISSIEEQEKEDRAKLMFTAPRAREDSLPSELIKGMINQDGKTYSFLDLLAADGYETNDLEGFEEQVILKLDRLKEHILHQFNPVFNELNVVRKRLRHLAEQSNKKKDQRKSIMREN